MSFVSTPAWLTSKPPALSLGLLVFWALMWFPPWGLSVETALQLNPSALFSLNLNKLSLYPLCHASTVGFLLSCIAFYPLCATFERKNGTVRTGVVLNVCCFLPAILFCLITKLFGMLSFVQTRHLLAEMFVFPRVYGGGVWILTFASALGVSAAAEIPSQLASFGINIVGVPEWAPAAVLFVLSLFWPGTTVVISILTIGFGFALGKGLLDRELLDPTSRFIVIIESKIKPVIQLLSVIVDWRVESEARNNQAETVSSV